MSTAISPPPSQQNGRGRGIRGGGSGLLLPFDLVLLVATLGVVAASLVTLHGIGQVDPDFYLKRQLGYAVVGFLAMLVLSRVDYSRLRELKWGVFALMLVSLVLVKAVGNIANGARRAIVFGPVSFQASELGKVLIILVISAFLVDRTRRLQERDTAARAVLLALIPAALVMLQPDLGSALVYIAVCTAVLFVVGIPWRHFVALGALGAIAIVGVLVIAPAAGVELLHDYQKERLTAFLDPNANPGSSGYQQYQARIAIGAGGKTGRGDRATQTNDGFLPEEQTDFAFATLAERYGFVGGALLLSCYALMCWRALRALTVSKNLFGALVAGGILAMLLFQVFVNVGMNVGIMPITGIPAPLMSYGGSSVITTFLAIGLLQSIYAQGRAATAHKGSRLAG